jgi:lysophospholipase L1-like esterase
MDLKLVAYGACLVGGFAVPQGKGFIDVAADGVARRGYKVDKQIFAREGRLVSEFLPDMALVLDQARPDVVLLQLGTTDANIPLKRQVTARFQNFVPRMERFESGLIPPARPRQFSSPRYLTRQAGRLILAYVHRAQPKTPDGPFVEHLDAVLRAATARKAVLIVVGPVPMADTVGRIVARRYRTYARDACARFGAHFIDPFRLLRASRDQMFLADGLHLTVEGHRRIGEALGAAILGACPAVTPVAPMRAM